MSYNFPSPATVGQVYPDPAWVGATQYKWDGTAWVALSVAGVNEFVKKSGDAMSGFLTLHANPDAAMKAATKQFVDNAIASVDLSTRVAKTGDTMSGHLTLPTGPAAANAVRKDYVDTADALKLALTGGTLTGNLTLNTGTLYLRRLNQPTEGLIYFGNADAAYIHYTTGAQFYFTHAVNCANGAIVPTRPAEFTGWVANTAYVEDRAYQHAVGQASAYADQRVYKGGDTMSGTLTAAARIIAQGGVYSEVHTYGGSAGSLEVYGAGGAADAMLSFHRPGAFGINFGLRAAGPNAGHLSYGGWSHGGSVFDIHSSAGYRMAAMMNQIADGITAVDVPETRSSLRAAKTDLRDLLKLAAKHFEKVGDEEKKQWRKPNGRPFDE